MYKFKNQKINIISEKEVLEVYEEPTILSNLTNFANVFTETLSLLFGLRTPGGGDLVSSSPIIKRHISCPRITAYVQFKASHPMGFGGVVTFFQQPNGSTVVYGQWNGLGDINPMNYEFVIYKDGVMQRDMTINIRRDIEVEASSAFLLTTFDSLPLSGIDKIIGGCLYISNCGRVIAKSEIYKI